MTSRVPELGKPGSVGALGERSPKATRRVLRPAVCRPRATLTSPTSRNILAITRREFLAATKH
jgi:hypothetical protein